MSAQKGTPSSANPEEDRAALTAMDEGPRSSRDSGGEPAPGPGTDSAPGAATHSANGPGASKSPLDPQLAAGPGKSGRLSGPVYVWWMRVVPFFLSAAFFLSALFLLFSPMPLLFFYFRSGRKAAWAAAATNCLLVGLLGGAASLALYLVFVVSLALILPELLVRRASLEKSALATLAAMFLIGAGMIGGYARIHHTNPAQVLKDNVEQLVKTIGQASVGTGGSSGTTDNGGSEATIGAGTALIGGDIDEWREDLYAELPSAIAVFSLVLLWANLVAVIRTGVGGVRERYGLDPSVLRSWRAPEWLVWPTIAAGFCLLIDFGGISDVALNVFKFLMAVYAIQGLSILSFFFDIWNVRGVFRAFGYLVGVFLMMPLLLSLGFFDLWFDFRSKFRQS